MEGHLICKLFVNTFDDVNLAWWRISEAMKKLKRGCIPSAGQLEPTIQYAGHVLHPAGILSASKMKRPPLYFFIEDMRTLCEGLLDLAHSWWKRSHHNSRITEEFKVTIRPEVNFGSGIGRHDEFTIISNVSKTLLLSSIFIYVVDKSVGGICTSEKIPITTVGWVRSKELKI